MKEIKIANWEQFVEKIKEVYTDAKKLNEGEVTYVSKPVFRGQSNASWPLVSTLDRIKQNVKVKEYLRMISSIQSSIESLTSSRWSFEDIESEMKEFSSKRYNFSMGWYQYMTHLRHHRFPSPLIDWTRSPYIAAFFAFNESKNDVAIFMYMEYLGQGKASASHKPKICTMGPNVTTHRRHHLQQCEYTFCIEKANGELYFASHEEAFKSGFPNQEQDLLEKYILPASQKSHFLTQLNLMNINAYSLFETEEGLMNKLANSEFIIGE